MSLSDPSTWGHLPTFLRGVRSQPQGTSGMRVEAQDGRACSGQGLEKVASGDAGGGQERFLATRDSGHQDTQATWRPASPGLPAADPPSLRLVPMGSLCFLTTCVKGKIMSPKGHVWKS